MAEPVGDFLTKYWAPIAGAGVAGWTLLNSWLSGRRKDKDRTDRETASALASADRESAAKLQQRNELIGIAEEVSGKMISRLQAEAERLAKKVEELEDEVRDLQKAMNGKEAELTLVRGDLRQWKALAAAYERLLELHNIPHEKPVQPIWRVEAGDEPTAEAQQP
jgi:chromosome segregation ATPase